MLVLPEPCLCAACARAGGSSAPEPQRGAEGGTLAWAGGGGGMGRSGRGGLLLCAWLKVGREEAGARNNGPMLSFPTSGVPLDRECSPELREIGTLLAWDLPPSLLCRFLCKPRRFL